MLKEIQDKVSNLYNFLLSLEYNVDGLIEKVFKYGAKILIAIFLWYFGTFILERISIIFLKTLEKSNIESTVFKFLKSLIGVVIKIVLFLLLLSYFGVPTTSIIAVFGSIGLAIGLAAQGILANFVSGFIVLNSNFFRSGDYIKCGDVEGKVEDIEIFFTTLITFDGKLIKIPNSQFTNTSVINFSANGERKVVVEFQVPYSANIALVQYNVKELISLHEQIIKESEMAVNVKEYDPYYIVLEAKCYTNTAYFWDVRYFILDNIKDVLFRTGVELPILQIGLSRKA